MDMGSGYLFIAAVIGVVLAFVVAGIASGKGRSGFAWWIYALFLWPVALVHSLVMEPTKEKREADLARDGVLKKCPDCAELVQREARRCKHCGADLSAA